MTKFRELLELVVNREGGYMNGFERNRVWYVTFYSHTKKPQLVRVTYERALKLSRKLATLGLVWLMDKVSLKLKMPVDIPFYLKHEYPLPLHVIKREGWRSDFVGWCNQANPKQLEQLLKGATTRTLVGIREWAKRARMGVFEAYLNEITNNPNHDLALRDLNWWGSNMIRQNPHLIELLWKLSAKTRIYLMDKTVVGKMEVHKELLNKLVNPV